MKTLMTNSNDFPVAVDYKDPAKTYGGSDNAEGGDASAPFETITIEPGASAEITHTGWVRQRDMAATDQKDFTPPDENRG